MTYHLLMHFPTEGGVREVRGDQVATREYYMTLVKGEPTPKETMLIDGLEVQDKRTWVMAKPGRELEDIIIDLNTPDRVS